MSWNLGASNSGYPQGLCRSVPFSLPVSYYGPRVGAMHLRSLTSRRPGGVDIKHKDFEFDSQSDMCVWNFYDYRRKPPPLSKTKSYEIIIPDNPLSSYQYFRTTLSIRTLCWPSLSCSFLLLQAKESALWMPLGKKWIMRPYLGWIGSERLSTYIWRQ